MEVLPVLLDILMYANIRNLQSLTDNYKNQERATETKNGIGKHGILLSIS